MSNNVSDTLRKYGVYDSSYYRWKPTENGQIESFNGTMRNEILRGVEFESVREAREELENGAKSTITSDPTRR